MDKQEFMTKFLDAKSLIDADRQYHLEANSIDNKPIDIGPGNRNLIIVMEECSELICELVKAQTGKVDRMSLIQELADVIMGFDYIKLLCHVDLTVQDVPVNENIYDLPTHPIIILTNLQQQISKHLRGKSDKQTLTQAYSDAVKLCVNLANLYHINEMQIGKAINVKLDRLEEFQRNHKTYE